MFNGTGVLLSAGVISSTLTTDLLRLSCAVLVMHRYKEPSDARFSAWTAEECRGKVCLLAHARASLEVDLDAIRELLLRKLPGLLEGESIDKLREEWPLAM